MTCKQGHELTPENTFVGSGGQRRCRICTRKVAKKNYLLKRSGFKYVPPADSVPIPGFENYTVTRGGVVRNRFGKVLTGYANIGYYPRFSLSNNGKTKIYLLHRLLAELFIPRVEGKPYVNHIDGNKNNYSLDNLEWVTSSENMRHAVANGLVNKKSHSRKEMFLAVIDGRIQELRSLDYNPQMWGDWQEVVADRIAELQQERKQYAELQQARKALGGEK